MRINPEHLLKIKSKNNNTLAHELQNKRPKKPAQSTEDLNSHTPGEPNKPNQAHLDARKHKVALQWHPQAVHSKVTSDL